MIPFLFILLAWAPILFLAGCDRQFTEREARAMHPQKDEARFRSEIQHTRDVPSCSVSIWYPVWYPMKTDSIVLADPVFLRESKYPTGMATAYPIPGDSMRMRIVPDSAFVPSPKDFDVVLVPAWWVRRVDGALRQMGVGMDEPPTNPKEKP